MPQLPVMVHTGEWFGKDHAEGVLISKKDEPNPEAMAIL